MSYHFFAMFLGFVLDLLFGDPHWLPHPIRLIGNLIASLEKLNKKGTVRHKKNFCAGLRWLWLLSHGQPV